MKYDFDIIATKNRKLSTLDQLLFAQKEEELKELLEFFENSGFRVVTFEKSENTKIQTDFPSYENTVCGRTRY